IGQPPSSCSARMRASSRSALRMVRRAFSMPPSARRIRPYQRSKDTMALSRRTSAATSLGSTGGFFLALPIVVPPERGAGRWALPTRDTGSIRRPLAAPGLFLLGLRRRQRRQAGRGGDLLAQGPQALRQDGPRRPVGALQEAGDLRPLALQ